MRLAWKMLPPHSSHEEQPKKRGRKKMEGGGREKAFYCDCVLGVSLLSLSVCRSLTPPYVGKRRFLLVFGKRSENDRRACCFIPCSRSSLSLWVCPSWLPFSSPLSSHFRENHSRWKRRGIITSGRVEESHGKRERVKNSHTSASANELCRSTAHASNHSPFCCSFFFWPTPFFPLNRTPSLSNLWFGDHSG